MAESATAIGRAKTALVFGRAETALAIISTVVVHIRRDSKTPRIRFVGPVAFADATIHHISDTILPIIDGIFG